MENKLLSLEYISKAVDANFCGYSTSMRLGRRRTHMSERNHEVIKSQQLLDEYGNIAEPGWSRKQLQQEHRSKHQSSGSKNGTIIL